MVKLDLRSNPEIKAVVLAGFPSYRKHNCFVTVFSPTTLNSYWDGGSRHEYAIVQLSTLKTKPLPTSTHPYFDVAARGIVGEDESVSIGPSGSIVLKTLPEDFALVTAGTFCGKPATAFVYLNAANMPRLLGKGDSL